MNYKSQIKGLAEKEYRSKGFNLMLYKDNSNVKGITDTQLIDNSKMVRLNKKQLDFKTEQGFAETLVVLFHESEHINQWYDIQKKHCNRDIAAEMLVIQENSSFYYLNYEDMKYELEAERAGVVNAYFYLEENYPQIDAFGAIKQYIDNQIKVGDLRYRGHCFELCLDIEDVINEFDKRILLSQTKRVIFPYTQEQIIDNKDGDACFKMAKTTGYETVTDILKYLPDRKEQVGFLASYSLKERPEYRDFFKDKELKALNFDEYIQAYNEVRTSREFSHPLERLITSHKDQADMYFSKLTEIKEHSQEKQKEIKER